MQREENEREFFQNVWNHASDAFQLSFDEKRPLNKEEQAFLAELGKAIREDLPDNNFAVLLRSHLRKNDGKLLEVILQLTGLTRNKILQDLKAGAGEHRSKLRVSNHRSVIADDNTWRFAAPYLIHSIRRVLSPIYIETNSGASAALESLNQATWPGYIRQERAKKSGHEAEGRIAILLTKCGIPFEPRQKADNPMCKDAQIHSVSFDIVVPDLSKPALCVKATVHTANIGQYGESKDALEVDEARRMIDREFRKNKPVLLAFIDGVGFESNRAGLVGVLEKADEFCQFRTLWKLVVVAAFGLGLKCKLLLVKKDILAHNAFLTRYAAAIMMKERTSGGDHSGYTEAGDALISVRD